MSFSRYPKYKEIGMDGLSELPEQWSVSRLGFESWVRARLGWKGLKAEEYVDEGFAFLSTPNIKDSDIDFENVNFITRERFDESPEIQLREGDVLLAKDGSTLGTVNVIRRLPRPTTVNSSIAVITPGARLDGVFLYYMFLSSFMEQTVQRVKGGMGVPHLFQEDLNRFYLPIPTFAEQQTIVAFLDRETMKIDALVAEQRLLIELLKEKRQAVISEAVTKGLNPHAPMKDAGIEWFDEVPAHWYVARLKHVTRQITVGIVVEPSKLYVADGVPALRSLNVSPGAVNLDNVVYISEDANEQHAKSKLREGDLVAVRSGQPGATAVVPPSLNGCNCIDLIVIRRPHAVSGTFLCWYLASDAAVKQFSAGSGGAIQQHFNVSTAKDIAVPVPSRREQDAITDFLNDGTSMLDALIVEAQYAIQLLQERRTALISAAVTGQIDVRQLAEKQAAA